jgi:hypothetical protein
VETAKQDWPRMNTNEHELKQNFLFVCIRVHSWLEAGN